ncbi:hypothetical protein KW782_00650 [Candidatus Parcubacteria bacterium]|nr:hypothetical protein [Candidatus Parcubacteria bacterium]
MGEPIPGPRRDDVDDDRGAAAPPPAKKEESIWTVEVVGVAIILGLSFLTYIGQSSIVRRLNDEDFSFTELFSNPSSWLPEWLVAIVLRFSIIYTTLVTVLSLFFLVVIVYSLTRWRYWEVEWQKLLYPSPDEAEKPSVKNEKWQRVEEHVSSDSPSDWRLAILEADIILDELLDNLGYIGDTIGDKLKKVTKGDFQTLDSAWEAHKIRNAIAHEGQDFVLTQREAQRVIGLYKQVFQEFDYV